MVAIVMPSAAVLTKGQQEAIANTEEEWVPSLMFLVEERVDSIGNKQGK